MRGPSSAVTQESDEARAWLTLGGGSWEAMGSKILGGRKRAFLSCCIAMSFSI